MSIKLIRLFTGEDGQSHFVVGTIDWALARQRKLYDAAVENHFDS